MPIREPIFPIGPSIAYIPLTRGIHCLVDSFAPDSVFAENWQAYPDTSTLIYARRKVRIGNASAIVQMHRIIVGVAGKALVDHVNGNSLDNRLCNLRVCTNSQNMRNKSNTPAHLRNLELPAGIKLCSDGKYEVYRPSPYYQYLGRYASLEDAIARHAEAR